MRWFPIGAVDHRRGRFLDSPTSRRFRFGSLRTEFRTTAARWRGFDSRPLHHFVQFRLERRTTCEAGGEALVPDLLLGTVAAVIGAWRIERVVV